MSFYIVHVPTVAKAESDHHHGRLAFLGNGCCWRDSYLKIERLNENTVTTKQSLDFWVQKTVWNFSGIIIAIILVMRRALRAVQLDYVRPLTPLICHITVAPFMKTGASHQLPFPPPPAGKQAKHLSVCLSVLHLFVLWQGPQRGDHRTSHQSFVGKEPQPMPVCR